jgi:glycine oxidase
MEIEAVWTGFRPTSDDDAPILGVTPIAGLVLATGHHRNGILLAPVTAQAIRDLVTAGEMAGAATHFGLARFAPTLQPREQTHAAQRQW